MFAIFKWAASGIIPPRDLEDKDAMYKWMIAVAATLGVWSGGTVLLALLSFGFVQFIFPGFALASDVHSSDARLVLMQKDELEGHIRDLKGEQCAAYVQNNQAALSAITTNLEGKKEEYRMAIGGEPSVPGCEELLIGAATARLHN